MTSSKPRILARHCAILHTRVASHISGVMAAFEHEPQNRMSAMRARVEALGDETELKLSGAYCAVGRGIA